MFDSNSDSKTHWNAPKSAGQQAINISSIQTHQGADSPKKSADELGTISKNGLTVGVPGMHLGFLPASASRVGLSQIIGHKRTHLVGWFLKEKNGGELVSSESCTLKLCPFEFSLKIWANFCKMFLKKMLNANDQKIHKQ